MTLRSATPFAFSCLLVLSACGGVALNTTVADTADVRRAMVESFRVGITTETAFVTRWGPPAQKAREGARTEFIYRNVRGDGSLFVIATFDSALGTAIRSTETESCRATFAPRVPGYGFDRPDEVRPIGYCGPAIRPGVTEDIFASPKGALPK